MIEETAAAAEGAAVREAMPGSLTGSETLVGVHGGTTAIIGEVSSSWSQPGFHIVETEFGHLLLDSDRPVLVLDDRPQAGPGSEEE